VRKELECSQKTMRHGSKYDGCSRLYAENDQPSACVFHTGSFRRRAAESGARFAEASEMHRRLVRELKEVNVIKCCLP